MSEHTALTDELCIQTLRPQISSGLYRVAQVFYIVLSLVSIFPAFVVIRNYRRRLFMHGNLRILFYALLICGIAQAFVFVFTQTHNLYVFYLATNKPCAIVMSKPYYIFARLLHMFLAYGRRNLFYSLIIERITATIFLANYERHTRKLGYLLLLISAGFAAIGDYLVHLPLEMFDSITLNVLFPSVTSLQPANIALGVYAVLNFISLVITVILYAVNKKASRQSRFALSSSFQTAENIAATSLICWTLTAHIVIMMVFESSTLYLRTSVERGPMLIGLRMLANVAPLAWLSFPLIIMVHVKLQKQSRRQRITQLTTVKTTGNEGVMIYSSMLSRQWAF